MKIILNFKLYIQIQILNIQLVLVRPGK